MFSIIIPLYNRPDEIDELLASLCQQTYTDFEVVIVEDGSSKPAKDIVESYKDKLEINYFSKPNEGQGFARNYGFERAKGDFFIVLDSDVLVPEDYLLKVKKSLDEHHWDAFGGPDAAHESFTDVQKAISYSMTSPLTTGGIRGNKKHVGHFHPRSFNMGISRKVWEATRGYKLSRRSEDIEFSIRMINQGYKVGLISEAFVYHKRRTNIAQFFKQVYGFGKGRIDISMLYPGELKFVHALPAFFTLGFAIVLLCPVFQVFFVGRSSFFAVLSEAGAFFLLLFTLALFCHSWISTRSIKVALLSVVTSYTQILAYGIGFIQNFVDRKLLNKDTSK